MDCETELQAKNDAYVELVAAQAMLQVRNAVVTAAQAEAIAAQQEVDAKDAAYQQAVQEYNNCVNGY